MTTWQAIALGDLGEIITGTTPPARHPDWFGDETPFITPTDISEGNRRARPQRWLSSDGRAALRSKVLPAGSVGFVCIGATIGKLCLTELESVTNQQINSIVPNADTDGRFVYYLLRNEATRIAGMAGGAATPILNKSAFSSVVVRVPDLLEQTKISSVLGGIDDLIENNERRAEVLHQIAGGIYREWFVRFRFPGHESVEFVDSPLGRVPESWTWSTCGDELNFIGGGTPSKTVPAYWDNGTVAWYTPSDLTKNHWRYAAEPELCITDMGVAKSSARRFPAGSVLMTSRATLGVLAIASTEATTNQGFIVVLPDDRWSSGFIREWLDVHAPELAAIATGATFKEITKGAFKRVPFLVPTQTVLDAYTAVTEPLEMQILNLERQVRSLSTLRDLMLPKLVTGQINVSALDLDALVEDAVA
ncbi:restriction endonuclease subunit S [Mycolicibacterium grossiae]|uniref:restriction endonuclease subunit S n=1 Tax=Mycolicibacterium grossiae TaxID=1552759 RepID=UPI0009F681E6|nr:restriction endonuclease subunit S [Mycolicibacterium grossiae]